MKERIKILKWKICIIVLGILLFGQMGALLANMQSDEETPVQHFQKVVPFVREGRAVADIVAEDEIEPSSYIPVNYERIRVIITNKENGSIYHEAKESICSEEYRGEIEIIESADGFVFINDLPVEEYLLSVVPSEMPSAYPMEALKAQAICARTYAYLHISSPGYPEWNAHVDDTTAYQVYHSVEEQERTNRAVQETEGMILLAPDGMHPAQTYYYSTSCGFGSDAHVWKTEYADDYPYLKAKHINEQSSELPEITETSFTQYILTINDADYEAEEAWYRWNYEVDELKAEHILKVLRKRYQANPEYILTLDNGVYVSKFPADFDEVLDISIESRTAGGAVDELLIVTDKNIFKIITELNIRYVLDDGKSKITRLDGTQVRLNSLLPSAFFVLENEYTDDTLKSYRVVGGGFGHGAGMSQNAAKQMAEEGKNATDILHFFFEDCKVGEF